jgi:uncharacterized protein YijF (DUF1287 family)
MNPHRRYVLPLLVTLALGGWNVHSAEIAESDRAELDRLVLEGAKQEVLKSTRYNADMLKRYVPTYFRNGIKYDRPVYPLGDVDPNEGVCTDTIVRALRNANYDLQREVHEDVVDNLKYYGISAADKYIDHRRVWVLLKFFSKNFRRLPADTDWRPGDIVMWDIGSKEHLHTGILSDETTRSGERYLVIHNIRRFPLIFPGRTSENDVLYGIRKFGIRWKKWKILGHFRLSELK